MDWTNEPLNWTAGQIVSESDMDDSVTQCFYDLKLAQMLEAAAELTIAVGVVTVTRSHHDIDTEADAASDDLNTISGGAEGDIIYLRAENAARVVTLKNGTGTGALYLGQDIALTSVTGYVALIHNGTGWSLYGYTDLTGNTLTQTLTNKTLTSPTINGTIATTGLTVPALTLSGSITGASQTMTGMGTINGLAITANTGAITTGTWTATVIGAAYGGTGVANNAASTLTISGNFATTFTITNVTGLTLPTTGTLATLEGTEELDNKTLDTSVAKGTWTSSGVWTIPATTCSGTINLNSNNITNVAAQTFISGGAFTSTVDNGLIYFYGALTSAKAAMIRLSGSDHASAGRLDISTPNAAADAGVTRLIISGKAATATATWSNITHTGLVLTASSKLNPASGVAGFSVVSTSLTLGSLGSMLIPQSAAACTDALAGNIDGCIGINATEDSEAFYFRANGEWYYINKTGGLSMTKGERIDPTGHTFQTGDLVQLIVDKVNADGSFHALPYYAGRK